MKLRRILMAGAAAIGFSVQSLAAHPHVFVDMALEFVLGEDGRLEAIQVVWVFDEFFSLLEITDLGLDADGDGELTEEERETLSAVYTDWREGFSGGLYPEAAGQQLALSGPLDLRADYREDRLIVVHRRELEEGVAPDREAVVIRTYDPEYYIDYTVVPTPTVRGEAQCDVQVRRPDAATIEATIMRYVEAMDPDDTENEFPAIGAELAEEVWLTCDARS